MGRLLNFEKILFLVCAAAFLFSVAVTWKDFTGHRFQFREFAGNSSQKEKYFDLMRETPLWNQYTHALFVSRPLVYDFNQKKSHPLDLSKTGKDGISYEWKWQNGFSLKDPDVAKQDPDNDGFSNMEEYRAKTDPQSAASSPPAVMKLRVKQYQFVPFQFIFQGYTRNSENDYEYQINVQREGGVQTLLVKPGQKLTMKNGMVWTVGKFRKKIRKRKNPATDMEQEYDESELDLQIDGLKDGTVTLQKGQVKDSRESYVDFVALVPGERPILNVSYGAVFSFKGEAYRLIEADAQKALVKHLGSEELIFIPALEK